MIEKNIIKILKSSFKGSKNKPHPWKSCTELFSHNYTKRKYLLSWLAWCLCLGGSRFSCGYGEREKNKAVGLLTEGNKLTARKCIKPKPCNPFCCFAGLLESQKVKWEEQALLHCPSSQHLYQDTAWK